MTDEISGKTAKHEFYQAVGNALGQWYAVERNLFLIFNRLAGGSIPINSAIFYAVISLSARRSIIDEVAKITFRHDQKMIKRWLALSEKVKQVSSKRNHLAHFMPMVDLTVETTEEIWRLMPHMHDRTTRSRKSVQIYTTKKIEDTSREFQSLSKELETFFTDCGLARNIAR